MQHDRVVGLARNRNRMRRPHVDVRALHVVHGHDEAASVNADDGAVDRSEPRAGRGIVNGSSLALRGSESGKRRRGGRPEPLGGPLRCREACAESRGRRETGRGAGDDEGLGTQWNWGAVGSSGSCRGGKQDGCEGGGQQEGTHRVHRNLVVDRSCDRWGRARQQGRRAEAASFGPEVAAPCAKRGELLQ